MISSTLFVVIDPTTEDQKALRRAEQLAVDTGARLHLFCCDYQADLSAYSSRKEAKNAILSGIKQTLETHAKPLRDEGITVTTEAYWNDGWEESVIRASSRVGADLILKSSEPHSRIQRQLQKTSDITLLRKASCAVLLVREDRPWTEQRLLAAVTLDTNDADHDLLNNQIITQAQRLAHSTQSQLHCVAAIDSSPDLGDVLKLLVDDDDQGGTNEEIISQRFGIVPERIHVVAGPAKEAIIATAEQLKVDALIIGTIARKGVKALLIGNTAEKILDHVTMDILVVN